MKEILVSSLSRGGSPKACRRAVTLGEAGYRVTAGHTQAFRGRLHGRRDRFFPFPEEWV
jgi:hypothetical protein